MMKRSIYLQLVGMLIGIIFLSNLLAMVTFVFTTERGMLDEMNEALSGLTTQLKSLYADGLLAADRIPPMLQTGYFRADVYGSMAELRANELVRKFFRPTDLEQLAEQGEVRSRTHNRATFRLPAAIVRLGNEGEGSYLFVRPNLGLLMFNFRNIVARVNMASLLVGSIMILLAGKYIVRPIKKLSDATKQISQGNFDVTISEKRRDEIGQLIDGFNAMAKELRNIEILRSDFVSAISHEFRTPLTSIRGYAKLMSETENAERRKDYAAIVAEETDRLSSLASSILLMSKLENEAGEFAKTTFRLDEQLRRVIVLLEGQWSSKRLDLVVDLATAECYANEELLFQVWLNLLDNAIKFSPLDAALQVTLIPTSHELTCVIRDFGIGIPPEHQTRVFEKFYKGDKSRQTLGSGLGLSIAKRIIELHNGTVTLVSSPGQGTTVTVRLPQPK